MTGATSGKSPWIDIDTDGAMGLANALRSGPESNLLAVHQIIQAAMIKHDAFGILVSNSPEGNPLDKYDESRETYRQGVDHARKELDRTAVAFANGAKMFAGVEAVNSRVAKGLGGVHGLSGYGGSDQIDDSGLFHSLGVEGGIVTAVGVLMPAYLGSLFWMQACFDMTFAFVEAEILYMLIEPNDDEIQRVVNQWDLATTYATNANKSLHRMLTTNVEHMWPSAPDSYHAWAEKFLQHMDGLVAAIAGVSQYFARAVDIIHDCLEWLLHILEAAFGALVIATALDVAFGIGESAKFAISFSVLLAMNLGFDALIWELWGVFGDFPVLAPYTQIYGGGGSMAGWTAKEVDAPFTLPRDVLLKPERSSIPVANAAVPVGGGAPGQSAPPVDPPADGHPIVDPPPPGDPPPDDGHPLVDPPVVDPPPPDHPIVDPPPPGDPQPGDPPPDDGEPNPP